MQLQGKMIADCLADVWLNLFQVCWEFSIVLLLWKESIVSLVLKKQASGVKWTISVGISPSSIVSCVRY